MWDAMSDMMLGRPKMKLKDYGISSVLHTMVDSRIRLEEDP